jgi:hypothetical protein
MPYVRLHALKEAQASELSKDLKKELASALKTTEESWEIELIQTAFFDKGTKTDSIPFIEIIWMTRPQEVQDLCAKTVTECLKKVANLDAYILFHNVSKNAFYKNGAHF